MARTPQTVELIVVSIIFCVGTSFGVRAFSDFRAAGGRPSFYQSEFAPAVLYACGRGLQNPAPAAAPALEPFLSERIDSIRCEDVPDAIDTVALDPFQRTGRYLELAVGSVWKLTGVSWSRLSILNGALFGAVAALTYGLYRLALRRGWALIAMVPIALSTPNLNVLPHLRDYAKGPFLLAVMLILGVLVVRRGSARAVLGLSLLAGIVTGIGLGFRTDLTITIPPFLVTAAFLMPAAPIRLRAAAIAVFLMAFGIAAGPVLAEYSRGNNVGPVVLLGLSAPFDRALGIEPSLYEFAGHYNDSYAFSIVNSYAARVEGRRAGVDLASPEHAAASMRYVTEIAHTFPADFVTRTLAAVRTSTRYFLESSPGPPDWLQSPAIRAPYHVKGAVARRLALLAVPCLAAATIAVSAVAPRAAWLIVLFTVAFAGSAAIQFHERHFFYLQFVPWCAFAFLAQSVLDRHSVARATAHWKRAAAFAAVVMLASLSVVLVTRFYQQRSAASLFAEYESAPRRRVDVTRVAVGADTVRLTTNEWASPLAPGSPRVAARFLAIRFRDSVCRTGQLPLTIRYEASLPELDFTEPLVVPMRPNAGTPTTLFVTAFDRPDETTRFRGIEIRPADEPCVDAIFDVGGLDHAPLLLTTLLPDDWRSRPLHQHLQ